MTYNTVKIKRWV